MKNLPINYNIAPSNLTGSEFNCYNLLKNTIASIIGVSTIDRFILSNVHEIMHQSFKLLVLGRPGVYIFWTKNGRALLVGSSENLYTRLRTYLSKHNLATHTRIAMRYFSAFSFNDIILSIDLLPIGAVKETIMLEQYYIDNLNPYLNVNKKATPGTRPNSAQQSKTNKTRWFETLSTKDKSSIRSTQILPVYVYLPIVGLTLTNSYTLIGIFTSQSTFISSVAISYSTLSKFLNENKLWLNIFKLTSTRLEGAAESILPYEKLISLINSKKDSANIFNPFTSKVGVIVIDTWQIERKEIHFDTISECAAWFKSTPATISRWVNGIAGRGDSGNTKKPLYFRNRWIVKGDL